MTIIPRTVLVGALSTLAACGGGSRPDQTGPTEPAFTITGVEIAPAEVAVEPGASVAFRATVLGTGTVPQAVRWTIASDPAGDPDVGVIGPDGTYTAPTAVSATRIQARATSAVDPGKSGAATIHLPVPGVSVSPSLADVVAGAEVQFAATVTGAVDTTVDWLCPLGGIDANGVLRTPADGYFGDYEVTATSWAIGKSATAIVRIRPEPPVLSGTSGSAAAGETLTIYGTGFRLGSWDETVVSFPAAAGERVLAVGIPYPDRITVVVPAGAASGPLDVSYTRAGLTSTSNEVSFERAPRLRVHADRRDLAAGESTRLRVAFLGGPPAPITYATDVGAVEGDTFVAPQSVDVTTYAAVRACVTGTTNCGGALIAVHPFLVQPEAPLVASGASLGLVPESAGTQIPASFSIRTGGGAIAPDGLYTASASLEDAGQAWITVDSGGRTVDEQLGVTGLVPGLVNRVVEYVDHVSPNAPFGIRWGTWVEALAVHGSRAFVAGGPPDVTECSPGSGCPSPYPDGSPTYFWIDVYDLTDPIRPSWLGAVECPARPEGMFVAQGRLHAWSRADPTAVGWSSEAGHLVGSVGTLVAFDLAGDLPRLVFRQIDVPPLSNLGKSPPAHDGESLFDFGFVQYRAPTIEVRIHALGQDPATPPRVLQLPLPSDCLPVAAATASGDRAYATCDKEGVSGQRVLAWDVASDPPVLLGSVEDGGWPVVIGPLLAVARARDVVLYDRSPGIPVKRATLYAEGASLPVAEDGGRVLLQGGPRLSKYMEAGPTYLLDVGDPAAPRMTHAIYGGQQVRSSAAFVGDLVYSAEGLGGIAVYDVSAPGGPIPRSEPELPPYVCNLQVWSAFVRSDHLLASAGWYCTMDAGTFLAVWDVSSLPPRLVWNQRRDWEPDPIRIAEWGELFAVGSPVTLEAWSLFDPGAPVVLSSLPLEVSCLAADGPILWAGTYGGDLVALVVDGTGTLQVVATVALGAAPSTMRVLGPGRLGVALAGPSPALLVLDTSSPARVALVGAAALGAQVNEIALDGTTAWLATDAGVATFDVSGAQPVPLGSAALPEPAPFGETYFAGTADSVAIGGGVVWVGSFHGGGTLHGFDPRNPRFPREIAGAGYSLLDSIRSIVPDGRRAFVAGVGIVEVDVTTPRSVVKNLTAPRVLRR